MFTNGKVRLPRHGSASTAQSRVALERIEAENLNACLVGAGSIANVHAEVLKDLSGVRIAALVESNPSRATAFAKKWGVARTYGDLTAALADGAFDAVHILTPPDTHFALAKQCLEHDCNVLVEKPLAVAGHEAHTLLAMAAERGVVASVNQNFIFHPAFTRLQRALRAGHAGPLRAVHVSYNVPLRQLAARQFGVWMFHQPKNILLEQAVHPLSQIAALIGPIKSVQASADAATPIAKGCLFHATCDAVLRSETHTAHLQFAVGRAFPFWQLTAVCDDGVLIADMLNNRFVMQARGPASDPVDALSQSIRTATALVGSGFANAADYVLSLAKLQGRSDPFYRSMKAGIGAFYDAISNPDGRLTHDEPVGFNLGANLVDTCEQIASQSFAAAPAPTSGALAQQMPADVVIIGGTGFIGAATVARFAAAGQNVRVVARNTANLADVFHAPNVSVVRGDIADGESIAAAIHDVPVVINLAHGGGGENWTAIQRAMVGGTATVAEACLAAGTKRLIHVGSIAGVYAGDPDAVITGVTPADPNPAARADYARAKVETDCMLLTMHRTRGLPVCILRPGVVVGSGTSPFHSGLGVFNNEQHCIGWNLGDNALPLVLVDDVADAIFTAATSDQAVGRSYNLVGDVRLTARAYIAALGKALRRPLVFHPSRVRLLYAQEYAKWLIKRLAGRKGPPPSLYDFRSRGLVARFDCSDAKQNLSWAPESDTAAFIRKAFPSPQ